MLTFRQSVSLFLIVLSTTATAGSAEPAGNSHSRISIWADAQSKKTSAQSKWVESQAKVINAQATWITAVANANATNAKTLQTLQQVRGLALENNLKRTKTFYEKRKLHEAYQNSHTRKRPTKEDLIRYSKASAPKRPSNYHLNPLGGKIFWPEALQQDESVDYRVQLESLFARRKTTYSMSGNDVSQRVQNVVAQMREQLRSKIRQMDPMEYIAAARFLEGLAYEARFLARIEGLASN